MAIGLREVGTFGGEFGARHCNQWGLYGVRVQQHGDAALFPNDFGQTCYFLSQRNYPLDRYQIILLGEMNAGCLSLDCHAGSVSRSSVLLEDKELATDLTYDRQ